MKSMMMSIMVMVCVLLVLHEEMSVEAGKLQRIGKKIQKAFDECCKKIKCFIPDQCEVYVLSADKCKCLRFGDKKVQKVMH